MEVHERWKEAGTVQEEDRGRKGTAAASAASGAQGQGVEGEAHGEDSRTPEGRRSKMWKKSSAQGRRIRSRGGWGDGGAAQLPAEEINAHGNLQQEVARVAGQRRRQSRELSGARGGRERGFSQRLVCKTEETQGPYGKLTFPTDTKI
jgi:hypothetical protein